MTAPFVSQLRSRGDVIELAPAGAHAITVRVEMPELWDTVRAHVSPTTPIAVLKSAALDALNPGGDAPDAFVMKLRGFEVLDETASLNDVGAVDGSIFLLTYRRRRPVR
jgi:hypothetical protein